jgi:hypothetical protein
LPHPLSSICSGFPELFSPSDKFLSGQRRVIGRCLLYSRASCLILMDNLDCRILQICDSQSGVALVSTAASTATLGLILGSG